MTHVIDKAALSHSGTTHRFEGYLYGGADVSSFLVDASHGGDPGLHTHPCEEVFVMQEGGLTFAVGETTIEARSGQIVLVPAGVPHKYVNSGSGRAKHIDVHAS